MTGAAGKLIEELKGLGAGVEEVKDREVYLLVGRDNLRSLAKALYSAGAYLKTCVGVDERQIQGVLSVYYIFGLDELGVDVVLRVPVAEDDARVPTIVPEVPAADWCELEARDMVGVEVTGRPVRRLV
ncbi:MAG: NADH-quinone oxidoreductase subunit C, partial [Desulfurococcaceae archaeon]|nr:NADH-quinone oxidoreductase subunit C [Desulfurococcaceae archaeon]